MSNVGVLAGFVADRALGDPRRGHPVAGFGRLATAVEQRWWRDDRAAGAGYVLALVGLPTLATVVGFQHAGRRTRLVLTAATVWSAVGGRSLEREATRIADALVAGDLAAARARLPALCGRDPATLDSAGLCRAVIESVAENTADAVVAPLLYAAAAGPAGVVAHRCANTLDAMVGHRSPRYERFGWAAARSDDVLGWVPARLTVLCLALAATTVARSPRAAFAAARQQGANHPSPNAGRCEAAAAGALGVRLGGCTVYAHGSEVRGPFGDGRDPTPADVHRAVRLARAAAWLAALLCVSGGRAARPGAAGAR